MVRDSLFCRDQFHMKVFLFCSKIEIFWRFRVKDYLFFNNKRLFEFICLLSYNLISFDFNILFRFNVLDRLLWRLLFIDSLFLLMLFKCFLIIWFAWFFCWNDLRFGYRFSRLSLWLLLLRFQLYFILFSLASAFLFCLTGLLLFFYTL
jgi:hypothetical protein